MAGARDFTRMAMSLEGTVSAPHFDRTAFKVARTYATLAADGKSANFKFAPEEQEFKCMLAPQTFTPVAGGWGKQGWTTGALAALGEAELRDALTIAWAHAQPKKAPRKART